MIWVCLIALVFGNFWWYARWLQAESRAEHWREQTSKALDEQIVAEREHGEFLRKIALRQP